MTKAGESRRNLTKEELAEFVRVGVVPKPWFLVNEGMKRYYLAIQALDLIAENERLTEENKSFTCTGPSECACDQPAAYYKVQFEGAMERIEAAIVECDKSAVWDSRGFGQGIAAILRGEKS
jgi:hypothetical protein